MKLKHRLLNALYGRIRDFRVLLVFWDALVHYVVLAAIVALALSTLACAKDKHPVCYLVTNTEIITYPDHQARKSDHYSCSDGCEHYVSTNDGNREFSTCDMN